MPFAETWTSLVDTVPHTPLLVGGTFMVMGLTYYLHGAAYSYLDFTHSPASLFRYRIQLKKSPPSKEDVQKVFRNLGWTTAFIIVPLLFSIDALSSRGHGIRVTPDLPSPFEVLKHMLCFTLVEDVLFFYGHYASHWPPLYQRVHKQHHEFKAPFAFAAAYAHPVEGLFVNLLPVFVGPVLLHAHLFTLWVWLTAALIVTQQHHGGYRFPWFLVGDQPNFHDYHHEKFTGNYGLLGVLDYCHDTDAEFQAYKRSLKGLGNKLKTDGMRALFPRCCVWIVFMATVLMTVLAFRM